MPWISEVLIEFYRRYKATNNESERMEIIMELRQQVKDMIENATSIEIFSNFKSNYRMAMEIQMNLDMVADSLEPNRFGDDEHYTPPFDDVIEDEDS